MEEENCSINAIGGYVLALAMQQEKHVIVNGNENTLN